MPPEPVLQSAKSFNALRLDTALETQNIAVPHTWEFRHLYWAAIYFNPSLAEAKSQYKAVKAAEQTASQSPNPTLTFQPSFDNSTSPNAWLLGLGLSVPIETNGKRRIRMDMAAYQSDSSNALLASKAWDIRNIVLNSMIDLIIARDNVIQNQELAKVQENIINVYAKRQAQGQIPSSLASQNQIAYQQTLLLVQQSKSAVANAEATLAAAIGVPVAAVHVIKITNTLPVMQRVVPEKSLWEHPAIMNALADFRAAHENLKMEIARQYPDINLGPGYEWNNQGGGKFTLGLSFTLPLLNNNQGPIAEAVAKREVAAKHFDTVQASVINAIEQANINYGSAKREMAVSDQVIAMQNTKQQRLQDMIKQKDSAELPILYNQTEIFTACINALVSKSRLLKSQASLEDAVKQPLFGNVISAGVK